VTPSTPFPRPTPLDRWRRRGRLVLKELRETIRDRRTILTLLLMPVLAYPLLGIAFQRLFLTQLAGQGRPEYHIGLQNEEQWRQFESLFNDAEQVFQIGRRDDDGEPASSGHPGEQAVQSFNEAPIFKANIPPSANSDWDVRRLVENGVVDVGIIVEKPPRVTDSLEQSGVLRLIYVDRLPRSENAYRLLRERLDELNFAYLRKIAEKVGLPPAIAEIKAVPLKPPEGGESILASLAPLILLLMTVTGAVYPAIDLTAGERERHTLETLIAAPVSRLEILFAKYLAVLSVAILTALINLAAMYVTMQAVGFEQALFGDRGLGWTMVASLLGLLTVFAAFFAAVLLCITSVARSFKEAQAYLIPLMLLSMAPGVVSLIPGIELRLGLAFVPLLNVVLLARATVLGAVSLQLAVIVIASTLLYGALALSLAGRWFGSDAVLAGSAGQWSDLFSRPEAVSSRLPAGVVASTFLAMFLGYFVLGSLVGRTAELTITARLALNALLTILFSGLLPWGVAVWQRVPPQAALRIWAASPTAFFGAILAGACAWPLVYEVAVLQERAGIASFGAEQVERVQGILQAWNDVPFAVVLICLAIVPAVFEELSFRGFLFSSLLPRLGGMGTVLATAIAFGSFHLVVGGTLAVERFIPSTLLGLLLGTVSLRSGSVVPGMLLHAVNNGLLLTIARYKEELQQRGYDLASAAHLPTILLAAAAGGLAVGMGLATLRRSVPAVDAREFR
jgi:ABC-2 type transport system permease protein/sodium transport system permease protein